MLDYSSRFWSKVQQCSDDECWPWIAKSVNHRGYGLFWRWGKYEPSNRVAWELTYGEIPAGKCVCHTCDNPGCCNPKHLWVGTTQENTADRERKGRGAKGERNGCTKLTEAAVLEIRSTPRTYGFTLALVKKYGVNKCTISAVLHGRSWKHLLPKKSEND